MILLLQFPEGLKRKALEYADKYKEQGHEVYLSCSPCFGACDLALEEAKLVNADKIIHFGHSQFVHKQLPIEVEYIEYKIDININDLKNTLEDLKEFKTIAIATTIQHVHQLQEIKEFFESNNVHAVSGKGLYSTYEGQVLGCDPGAVTSVAENADAILYIGDGLFHPLAIKINKPIYSYNPYTKEVKNLDSKIEKLKKKRKGMLAAAVVSKQFAILVSTKIGQANLSLAKKMKKQLEEKGKYVEILVGNTFDPFALENFNIFDCYVTTACPRISDDSEMYNGKPILDKELFQELIQLL